MIRKVKTSALKPGVFIHDYLCDKSKENIHLEQSLLKNMQTINILLSWGIKEVLIDTERGLDIQQAKQQNRSLYHSKESTYSPIISPPKNIASTPETFTEELKEAKVIRDDAVRFINNSMDQILVGRFPDLTEIYNLVRRMQYSIERSSDALSLLTRIRKKDEYTLVHSISVSTLMLRMCRYLNIPSDQALPLAIGALFHDIGKAEIETRILNKPGILTNQEFGEMKKHAQKSAKVLKDVSELPPEVYDIALHHHERCDGSGYPAGLMENQISLGALLTAVCDVFDAVTSDRCYRPGLSSVEGLKIIYDLREKHLPEKLTLDFVRSMGVYPVGSCVRIENELAGIVIAPTGNMIQPFVKIVYDLEKKKRLNSYILNLAEEDLSIVSYLSPSSLELSSEALLDEVSSNK
ncbi:MAG: HD-GYP domain-containing protein [Flavobacteriaceae bacterium]|nr:HD-GYP domain-containing protein [Desulfofustis sp.]NNK71245.1 HD-GYP domain-containing protein [Flavobacteriaceae bacterium]